MNEYMICKPILHSQGPSVKSGVRRIPFPSVYIVRGEDNLLTEKFVITQQCRAIEDLELVVPQNVKYLGLGCARITNQSPIVNQHSCHLPSQRRGLLVPAKVEKLHSWIGV